MKTYRSTMAMAALVLALGMMTMEQSHADTFGTGVNQFTLDFVDVGNAGNADDRALDNTIDTPGDPNDDEFASPHGGVNYNYRISTYEISQDDITKATNLGMTNVTAGAHTGAEPAANISWYEAAAFVNFLNLSAGYQAAYNLSFSSGWSLTLWGASDQASTGVDSGTNAYRHKDAYYFLPSEDEWYKAAYHQNDGVTANYWDYATGSNTAPTGVSSGSASGTAVYDDPYGNPIPSDPADVNLAGGLSAYGTMGQNGNVFEWNESAFDGINDSNTENRGFRGGNWNGTESNLRSSNRDLSAPPFESSGFVGFRVASVPEPSSFLLMMMGLWVLLLRRRSSRNL